MLRLKAKVVELESASQFRDKVQRATLRFSEADEVFATIRIANTQGWQLDQVLDVLVDTQPAAGGVRAYNATEDIPF